MISKEIKYKRSYTKEYGAGAASFLRLCEAFRIEGINRVVIADSWCGGIRCVLVLSKLGFQYITMIKTGTAGYCRK